MNRLGLSLVAGLLGVSLVAGMGVAPAAARAADPTSMPATATSPSTDHSGPERADLKPVPTPAPAATQLPPVQPPPPPVPTRVNPRAVNPATAPQSTATMIYSSYLPEVPVGLQSQISAYVSPQPAGGTLALLVDGVTVDTEPLSGGFFTTLYWTPSATGTRAVTVAFSGTTDFAASVSDVWNVKVAPPYPTGFTLDSTATTMPRTTPFTLTATLTPDPGVGQVQFLIDGTVAATVDLAGGVATYQTSIADIGGHSAQAIFLGNDSYHSTSSGYLPLTIQPDPETLTLSGPPMPTGPGHIVIKATVSPDPGGGVLDWTLSSFGTSGEVAVGPGGTADIDLGTLSIGGGWLVVTFPALGTKAQAVASLFVSVASATTTTLTTDRTVAYPGEAPVHLSVFVSAVAGWSDTVTFLDNLNGSLSELATKPVETMWNAGGASFSLTLDSLALGTHSITARYNGGIYAVSISAPVVVAVSPDTAVHATLTRSLSTFYPGKDGYRDTVALGGVLGETATVSVRVYSSTGALKRAWSLGSRSSGSYTVAWNGRTASGTQVPAGTYTVKASFKDVPGHLLTLSTKVVVNWRMVKWLTGTAIIRYGDQFSYYGTPGAHLYKSSDYSRGRILDSGEMINDCIPPGCDEIYGITSFQLKTSVLAYRTIDLGLVGHGFTNREHDGSFYTVNPTTGKWQGRLDLPDYSKLTLSFGISPSVVSTTGRFRVVFDMVQTWGDAWDIHYVKVRYLYAVWK